MWLAHVQNVHIILSRVCNGFATAFIKVNAFYFSATLHGCHANLMVTIWKARRDNDCSRRRSVQVECTQWIQRAQVGRGTVRPTSMQKAKADTRGRKCPAKKDARKKKGTAKTNARGRRGPAVAEKVHCVSQIKLQYPVYYGYHTWPCAVHVCLDLLLRTLLMFLCYDMLVSSGFTVSNEQPLLPWPSADTRLKSGVKNKSRPCLTRQAGLSALASRFYWSVNGDTRYMIRTA